ncbi:MAG TPA: phosphonate ABC transporter, permease protein PhnE [Candidatus Tetragenococcus pullicola]|nr:phosphonate ABC transporter, permease protein PhnE [Candidatus Tetragenococcus pullicola]
MLTKKPMTLSNGKQITPKRSFVPLYIALVLAFSILSIRVTDFSLATLIARGQQFNVILSQLFDVKWSFVHKVWQPLLETIKMSLLGSLLGSIVALPLAMLSSANIVRNKFVAGFFKFLLSVLRTLPTLVVALIATFIVGLGSFAGTIAIFIFTISYVGKVMYEQIENIDMRTFEALESFGLTKFQAFRYSVLSEILPNFMSTSLYCFEGNVRYASILGYVGAGGLGLLLNERLGWRDYGSVGAILVTLVVTVVLIETLSETIRQKLQ